MKRIVVPILFLFIMISMAGCGSSSDWRKGIREITSYREIPGVTEAEITAIEKLKQDRNVFTYGSLITVEPLLMTDEVYMDFTSKICTLLSELFETTFIPMTYDDWQQLKIDVDQGDIDFTNDLTTNAERLSAYLFTKPIADRKQHVYTLVNSDVIHKESDVNGRKLGFIKNSVNLDYILDQYPHVTFDAVLVDDITSAENLLLAGDIDAFVTEKNFDAFFVSNDLIQSNDLFPLASTPLSIISANTSLAPVVSVIDKYLAAGGIDQLYEYYKEDELMHKKRKLINSFTEEELAYIENLTAGGVKVRTGFQSDMYPVSFYNQTEKTFQGAAIDIMAEITKLTGIEFTPFTVATNIPISTILNGLTDGSIAMTAQLSCTESRKDKFLWSDVPYLSTKYAMLSKVGHRSLELFQVPYERIGTINDSAYAEMFAIWFPGHENYVTYDTADEAFTALERDEVDLLLLSEVMLLKETNYQEKTGFKISISFDTELESYFGFNKNEVLLNSIINKTLRFIDIETITKSWLNRNFDYDKKISKIRSAYLGIFALLLLAGLLALGLLLLANKRLSKNLLERTTKLTAIYASMPDLVFSKDANGVYTSCNASFEKYAGASEKEVVGKTDADLFKRHDPDVAKSYAAVDKRVLEEGVTNVTEETITYPDGKKKIIETLKAPMYQNGKTVGLLGIGRDIAERREANDRLQRIINTAQIAFILTVDGVVMEVNEYSRKNIGVQIGDDIRAYYADLEQREEGIRMADRFGTASNMIIRYNTAGGEAHRFLSNITSVEYDGKKAYIVWALDVEQDEIKNDQLRVTQESLRAVLDILPMPIRIVDMETSKIVYANNPLVELLGYDSAHELYGLNIRTILPEVMSDGLPSEDRVVAMLKAGKPSAIEIEYLHKSGRVIEALVVTSVISYKGKHSSIGIVKDLSAEKEHARILVSAMEREKEANQAKSMFLANMSHEIRTPMNGIIGMTDLLLGEHLSGRQLQYAKDIKNSAESLLGIINDILDLSKINEGRLQITPVDINLNMLLKNTVSMMSFNAKSKGLAFDDEIQINDPEYVRVDDVRLKQILVNLLSNSVKFTKKGFVKLFVKVEDGNILFKISDSGIGIRQDDIPLIFMVFEQADRKKNRNIKGTGLGLSITKNLVELMGGQIWLESEYEVGTTFYVTIPYAPGDASVVEAVDTEFKYIYAPTAQVLLVDDIQTNLTVGAGLLRLCGIYADVAISGRESIELIKQKDYDIVFMDHMMPEMDGIEAMQIIRSLGDKYAALPIVALTANAVNESRDLLLSSGMDDFLSKPIDKSMLMAILKKWLPAHRIEAEMESDKTTQNVPYSDILNAAARIEDLNVELALSRISGMQDVLEESLKQVAGSTDRRIKKMDMYLSGGDLRNFAIEAHGLKSALANIGATGHSERAAGLEIASKAKNMQVCLENFAVFASELEHFSSQLQAVFPKPETQIRPAGERDFLLGKAQSAINSLSEYEVAEVIDCLNELNAYTFGAETDTVLSEVRSYVEAFNYKQASSLLKRMVENN